MGWLPCNWQDWAALAAIVQAIIVVPALVYAGCQLREATRSRALSALCLLLSEIGEPDVRTARHLVLYDLRRPTSPADVAKMDKENRDKMTFVAVRYDRVGYMMKEHLMSWRPLFDFHGDDIELLWGKIEPVIRYYRTVADPQRPNYCESFRWLATVWLPKMKEKYGAG